MTRNKLTTILVTGAIAIALGGVSSAEQPGEEIEGEDETPVRITPAKQKIDKAKLKRVYKVIKAEPEIKQVQKWALRYHDLNPGRVKALQRNARLKGLFPEVEAGLDNSVGNSFTNTRDGLFPILPNPPQNPNPENFKERVSQTNDNLTWRVRAVWSLDKLELFFEMTRLDELTATVDGLTGGKFADKAWSAEDAL